MADKKRINWVALSAFCIGLGVLFVLSVSVALTRNSSVASVRSDLIATEAASEIPPNVRGAELARPTALVDARQPASIPRENPPPPGNEEATPPQRTAAAAVTASPSTLQAPVTSPIDSTSDTSSTSITVAQPAPSSAPESTDVSQSVEQDPNLQEPPPNAAKGLTYCGGMTCNVGFKCCCDRCAPADQPCAAAECEAYTGLSVSVACGMDTCTPGQVCCDSRCGACARAGECPLEPCGG